MSKSLKYKNSVGAMLSIVKIEHSLVAVVDYLWVITLYVTCAFVLAITIDGHVFPKFEKEKAQHESSIIIFSKILAQLCIQGFIAILLTIVLHKIPSPVNGILGYDAHSILGTLVRNPAIISVVLFSLSASLKERLVFLYGRFVKNQTTEPYQDPLYL
jgi:magnesium-transporting ATPase (P-type)